MVRRRMFAERRAVRLIRERDPRRLPATSPDRDFTAEMPNEKWLTDITEIKARDGKVYLSPPIDCYDGKIVAYTAGPGPNAELANRMLVKGRGNAAGGGARPLVHFRPRMPTAGGPPDGWRSWTATAPAAVDGRQRPFPADDTAEGFLGAYKDRNPSISGIRRSVPATRCSS